MYHKGNSSPDNSNGRCSDRKGEQSQDAPFQGISFNQHVRMFGSRQDQQVDTNEASTSGLGRQSARQGSMPDTSLREVKLVELDAQEKKEKEDLEIKIEENRKIFLDNCSYVYQMLIKCYGYMI